MARGLLRFTFGSSDIRDNSAITRVAACARDLSLCFYATRMSYSQKAKVFGVLFVLAAGTFFFGSGASVDAQSADRFDRLDRITSTTTPQSGSTIVCIVYSELNGTGVPIPVLDAGSCSDQGGHIAACDDGMDNDADGLVDTADPGCHSDGNASNGATYVRSLDDESATVSGPPALPQCMNGTDDDGDGLADSADPGCHTDGDATNMGSYVTGDSSEGDPLPPENTLQLCSDGVDNDGDEAIDLADSGCGAFTPGLSVTVSVLNTHGGSATSSDMQLFVDGAAIAAGSATTTVGTHSVSATTTATSTLYTIAYGGDCAADGTVTLAIGDQKTCAVVFADVSTTTDPGTGGGGSGGGNVGGGGNGGGGGGGNGPIVGSLGGGGGGGPVTYGSTAPITPVTSCDTYLTAFIRFGAQNDAEQVRRLQTVLHDNESADIVVNGVYDTPTLLATRAFQQKYASEILTPWRLDAPTGFVYLTTRKKINEIYCRNTRQFPLSQAESAVIERLTASSNTTIVSRPRTAPAPARSQPQSNAPAPVVSAPSVAEPTIQEIQQTAAESQAGAAAGSGIDIIGAIRGFFGRLFNRAR